MTDALHELITSLQQLAELPPIERAKRCPELIDTAKTVLFHERGAAVAEAVDSGNWRPVDIARELGKSRQKVNQVLTAYRQEQAKAATLREG